VLNFSRVLRGRDRLAVGFDKLCNKHLSPLNFGSVGYYVTGFYSRKHNKHSRFFKPTESNFGILFSILILDSKMVRKVDGLWYFAPLSTIFQ
jgi:hypothetical protein